MVSNLVSEVRGNSECHQVILAANDVAGDNHAEVLWKCEQEKKASQEDHHAGERQLPADSVSEESDNRQADDLAG